MRGILEPKVELRKFLRKVTVGERFIFIRFSDGELEILRGSRLQISDSGVLWSKGQSEFKYPRYDHKDFEPVRDHGLREALIESATHRAAEYYKGIPTRHNGDAEATELMIRMNGSSTDNLTFSDLWINSNYPLFLREVLPSLQMERVTLVANFRTRPAAVSERWGLIPIGDGAFQTYSQTVAEVVGKIKLLPPGEIVLSSASSISNLIGHEISKQSIDVTFIDIGTALHDQLGLSGSKRSYLSQVKPWTATNFREKIGYMASRSSRIRW